MKVVYRGGEGEIVEKKSRFICTREFDNCIKKKSLQAA